MKWIGMGCAFAAFVTMAAPQATAGQGYSPSTVLPLDSSVVTVTGTAQVYVVPERAVVWLQVISERASPEAATLANGEARASVMEALRPLGFDEDQIGLWGFGTGPAPIRYGPPADTSPHPGRCRHRDAGIHGPGAGWRSSRGGCRTDVYALGCVPYEMVVEG